MAQLNRAKTKWTDDSHMTWQVHSPRSCIGSFCAIHRPSVHVLSDCPQVLRTDSMKYPLIERICPHGVGHPDPDSVAYLVFATGESSFWGIHGCDGCCRKED